MTEEIDQIYAKPEAFITDFNFGSRTAKVFDDMLERSVPFYLETQRLLTELTADYAQAGTAVYDLGCSTGTTLALLDRVLPSDVRLIGIDDSQPMLDKAKEKFSAISVSRPIDLMRMDLDSGLKISNASVVIMNLTLQFIRPLRRESVMKEIANGLVDGGCILLVEKVLAEEADTSRQFIKHYYEFKQRNGYTQMEISQKREALENILIPYRTKENEELLLKSGFSSCEIFFKWYNFCGYIARKGAHKK